jgi:hypothetical protein
MQSDILEVSDVHVGRKADPAILLRFLPHRRGERNGVRILMREGHVGGVLVMGESPTGQRLED